MFGLYTVQIILLGLLFVPALTSKCFDEDELQKEADRRLKHLSPQPSFEPAAVAESGDPKCPVLDQQHSEDISNRSISPWRYIRDTKEGRFPPTLAVAQCLCEGCIITDKVHGRHHSRSYNSALVKQSRVVLKKELCQDGKDGKKYRLVPENELVAVGCTCVKSRV